MIATKNRVLIVEDEDLVSMLVEEMLDCLGYQVSDSAATLEAGLSRAATGGFDVAMLDVNLRGRLSFPIADVLSKNGVPFIFVTGYGVKGIEPRFSGVPILQKPYTMEALDQMLTFAISTAFSSVRLTRGT